MLRSDLCAMKRYTRHTTHVQADEHATSRDRSAAIFGNRFFADVVAAVDRLSGPDDAFVTTRRVASETALSDSLVLWVPEVCLACELQ